MDIQCGTAGQHHEKFIIRVGGSRNPGPVDPPPIEVPTGARIKPADRIAMDGMGILAFTNAKIPAHVQSLLQRNGLGVQDVDLFVFHQASRMVLDSLTLLLEIEPSRTYSNLADVGNLVSASIPVALKDAIPSRPPATGSHGPALWIRPGAVMGLRPAAMELNPLESRWDCPWFE